MKAANARKIQASAAFDFALRGSRTFITVTFFYSIIILYLMFFGFGRIGAAQHTDGYTFMWVPDSVFSFRFPRASDLDFLCCVCSTSAIWRRLSPSAS